MDDSLAPGMRVRRIRDGVMGTIIGSENGPSGTTSITANNRYAVDWDGEGQEGQVDRTELESVDDISPPPSEGDG